LYLVRRQELDLAEISLADIADQYQKYLDSLVETNVNVVGDFLETASLLCEAKLRSVLPRTEDDESVDDRDPREDLVHRLLVYKEFKDAAGLLEEQARRWHDRFTRQASDMPAQSMDLADQPLREIELWDLVSSFGRILRDSRRPDTENILYDETPIQSFMERICGRLVAERRVAFSDLFTQGMHKSTMIGIFLAVLELVRHHNVGTEQEQAYGEIWLTPGSGFRADAAALNFPS
jgi:segregation and condensation protein A